MNAANANLKRIYMTTLHDNVKNNSNEAACKFCKDVLKLVTEMKSEMKEVKCTIQSQNEEIMAALATQKVLIQNLVRQEKNNAELKHTFPIKTLEELDALNDVINDDNHQNYVNAIKLLVKGKLKKTLTAILSVELILTVNVDGTHGKKRLKDYGKFFEALMDAVRPLCSDPDREIRAALTNIKKRHFHNVCVGKKAKD